MSRIDSQTEEKKLSTVKVILIVMSVFTLMPLLLFGVMYNTNPNFKYGANKYLKNVPGVVGKHFASIPTKDEREVQKTLVAEYMNSLDVKTASDKLLIIQNEDEQLYSELVQKMTSIDKDKTNKIIETIRNKGLKKDILVATVDEISNSKEDSLKNKAKYYENLSILNVVNEIKSELENSDITYEDASKVVNYMKDKNALELLKNLDTNQVSRLLEQFNQEKKLKFLNELAKMNNKKEELIKFAQIYNSEKNHRLKELIGKEEEYTLDQLSIIYRNMSIKKAGEVLALVEDKKFVYDLLNQIKNDEILEKGEDKVTASMLDSIKIYTQYNEKIEELEKIYAKMNVEDTSKIIEKLYTNRNGEKVYNLENGEVIKISDKDIAIELLRRLKQQTIGNVLASLNTSLASDISKKLALPN